MGAIGRMLLATEDIKMKPVFKPKDNVDEIEKKKDLQNILINLMIQGAPSASVCTEQDVSLN